MAAGCGEGRSSDSTVTRALAPQNRNVDILFLVDDSSSMRLTQQGLIGGFPTLMDTLSALPGGLPNIHVAVISSDMGAGDGSIAGCDATGGKNGIFQYTARGNCTATNLQSGATYISNVGGQANYTGNVSDVFTCIAALGETGCGFEHQLAAIVRALGVDGAPAPAENQGFVRPDALLAIVAVTNEDDCSEAPGVPLFDTTVNRDMASQLGPPQNFRCNEFGHLCSIGGGALAHPNRNALNNDATVKVTYDLCTSNDTEGYLRPVVQVANQIKAIKNDPERVMVTVIAGAKTPYQVHWNQPSVADTSCNTIGQTCPWPEITHSCTKATDGSFADPAVRMSDLVTAFGSDGFFLSICDDFGPSMRKVGEEIGQRIGLPVDGGIDDAGSGGTGGRGGSGGTGGTGGSAAGTGGGAGGRGGAAGSTGGTGGAAGSAGAAGGTSGSAGAAGRGGTGGGAGSGGGAAGAGGSSAGAGGSTTGRGGAGGSSAGGASGVGGSAAGGATGAGGSAAGGATGSGGSATGTGGAAAGTGGAIGAGGATGSGGSTTDGGAPGAGGTVSTGGATGAGGTAATGGSGAGGTSGGTGAAGSGPRDAGTDRGPLANRDGCGCEITGARGGASSVVWLLGLAVARRRRRRRAR